VGPRKTLADASAAASVLRERELPTVVFRDAHNGDWDSVCALNLSEVQFTSPMDRDRVQFLAQLASVFKVAVVDAVVAGFLIAMDDEAPYENANFAWFRQRYANFIYVDRIVIHEAHRQLRLATALYTDLIECAHRHGKRHLACEYNLSPPNDASARFHARLGFGEVGRQSLAAGGKWVSMQWKDLQAPEAP